MLLNFFNISFDCFNVYYFSNIINLILIEISCPQTNLFSIISKLISISNVNILSFEFIPSGFIL